MWAMNNANTAHAETGALIIKLQTAHLTFIVLHTFSSQITTLGTQIQTHKKRQSLQDIESYTLRRSATI